MSEYTYEDNARKEDLLDLITNLDYKEYQLVSGLGVSSASNILHQWLTDTLKTPNANAQVEGADPSFAARTRPVRLTNHTQIISIPYQVSDTERAVDQAGFNDRFSYEASKAMKEWKQDTEYALVRGTLACGNSSTARTMKGIKQWMESNNHTSQSGTSLTETMLNDYFQSVWGDGTEVNALYAPMYLKRKISAFTGGATKNVEVTDRRLVNAVDIYQADAASNVKLFAHRYVTISGDTNYDLIGLDEEKWKIAYLRKPKIQDIARTGDASKSQVLGELTLECYHKDAGFHTQALL